MFLSRSGTTPEFYINAFDAADHLNWLIDSTGIGYGLTLNAAEWHYFVFANNNSGSQFYQDGISIGTSLHHQSLPAETIKIFSYYDSSFKPDAFCDEIIIWCGREPTPEDVDTLYSSGNGYNPYNITPDTTNPSVVITMQNFACPIEVVSIGAYVSDDIGLAGSCILDENYTSTSTYNNFTWGVLNETLYWNKTFFAPEGINILINISCTDTSANVGYDDKILTIYCPTNNVTNNTGSVGKIDINQCPSTIIDVLILGFVVVMALICFWIAAMFKQSAKILGAIGGIILALFGMLLIKCSVFVSIIIMIIGLIIAVFFATMGK
jgi:hypothetical protein